MAGHGGQVQLEPSNMRLALNMVKTAEGVFSHGAVVETQFLMMMPRTVAQEETKRGVDLPWHKKVKTKIERYLAMLPQNHTAGSLLCHNGTAKNLQTQWRCTGTGAPPTNRRK